MPDRVDSNGGGGCFRYIHSSPTRAARRPCRPCIPAAAARLAFLIARMAVCIRVIFRRAQLLPEIGLLCKKWQQYILLQIQFSLADHVREFLIRQSPVPHAEKRLQVVDPHAAGDRNPTIAITLPILEDGKQTPACAGVPIFERIVIVVFHVHPAVTVRIDRYLQRIVHPVRHSRIVFEVGRVPQEEGDIHELCLREMTCIHRRDLQIYVGVERIDRTPAGIPLSRPHPV